METDVICITDHAALGELNIALDKCGDDLSKILQHVDNHLNEVMQELERQKAVLEKQYQEAEERLGHAERALSVCEAQRRWDEESGCYRPSCHAEKRHVEAARRHRDQCWAKYDEACRIVSRADGAIIHYRRNSMINPGPAQRLEALAGEHTDAATKELASIIDDVAAYLSIPQEGGYIGHELTPEEQERYNQLNDEIRRQQLDDMRYLGIAEPQQVRICPGCCQPITKCVCGKMHERGHIASKAGQFRKGSDAIESMGICPRCKRPKEYCICERGARERG